MVKFDGEQGTRQNLAAIFGSRAGSFRCRRPRANKEEEVGARAHVRSAPHATSPIACVAWLILPYTSAHISFDAPIIQPSSKKPRPIPRTTCFYSTVHYEQVVLLIFPPSNGCYIVNTIISVLFYHAKCPKSNGRITPVISCVLKLSFVLYSYIIAI